MSPIEKLSNLSSNSPGYVCFDTSFIMSQYGEPYGNSFGTDVNNALSFLLNSGTNIAIPDQIYRELASGIRNALLRKERENNPTLSKEAKDIFERNPKILCLVNSETERMIRDLDAMQPLYLSCNPLSIYKLSTAVRGFAAKTNLDLGDSENIITAKSYGVTSFLTCDKDYAKINDPNMTIYLPDRMVNVNTLSNAVNITIPYLNLK